MNLRVDPAHTLSQLSVIEQECRDEAALLAELDGSPVLRIRYEDYFADSTSIAATNRRVLGFLGVTPVETTSSHRKILPTVYGAIVDNVDEMREALRGTRFEAFLQR